MADAKKVTTYRTNEAPGGGTVAARGEMIFAPLDHSRNNTQGLMLLQVFSIPIIVAAILWAFLPQIIAGLGSVAILAGTWTWWKRSKSGGVALLRVEDEGLRVLTGNGKKELARFALKDLDVTLDTKTIQRVTDGDSAIPAMRFIDAKVGPEVDTSRVVLREGRREYPLTEAYVANMEASEWFGKVRVFLRKHGWVPLDEREPVSEAPPSSYETED